MGQNASKGLNKTTRKVTERATSLKRPPIPSRTTRASNPSLGNPGSFLRGEGIAAQDVRDKGQEIYLQQEQQRKKYRDQITENASIAGTSGTSSIGSVNGDMPEDLLKFIQDVGPANKSVDREFTTGRLLRKENEEELNKVESVRTAKRERVRMPLMKGEENFTTEKNTNFSVGHRQTTASSEEREFGLSNLQLYDLLSRKNEESNERIVRNFHQDVLSDHEEDGPKNSSGKGEDLKMEEFHLLLQTLQVLEIPKLRINADGDILGLYSKDVPGPEMTSIKSIPENKALLVLKHLSANGPSNERESAEDTVKKFAEGSNSL
mmetsp:Transcript_25818/g.60535  ORF Transcript_25818/g.60535 Transcript_25818/m.60535 type:complete len:321 (+) Transcript_25818:120-1082(+)|eukprot:CAMPEP_0197183490 /NCGR_PEP_ID=MMETSP1423-20130617/7846_1 /TAXON_ID=476441 /ORGANISM="Pseudo-nitzschia heimii, Strain UNC1101" /LENGTH=320 /DNA_ID=CAMNT_0042634075 /DNA_START=46 /DNA_END=1008 /DNA_ORIENTATION=+